MNHSSKKAIAAVALAAAFIPLWMNAHQASSQPDANSAFPGGTNPDGSLRPTAPVTSLFSQNDYTEYTILAPGSGQFKIRYLPEEDQAGATEVVNATRGGSEGSDFQAYDPRTGKPLKFTYQQEGNDPQSYALHVQLPFPVPEGGVGRVLIYKTYKDPRTYIMHGDDIVWVRSMYNRNGYRVGIVLPKGFAFLSANVAAQLTTTWDGSLKLSFANPSGQSTPVTIHARKTNAAFTPIRYTDMFNDDIKTLYDLDAPETHAVRVEQSYTDYRFGETATLDSLASSHLQDLKVVDTDTGKPLSLMKGGKQAIVKLEVPIVDDKQSAHLKITGMLKANYYKAENGDLMFENNLQGLRNTVLLPAGWDVAGISQSGTIGVYKGRTFVALINLNAENNYKVVIRARKHQ